MYMTRVRNEANSDGTEAQNVRDIFILSSIEHDGLSGMSAGKMIDQLGDLSGISRIDLHINSEGGDVFEGIAIYNLLKNANIPVNVHVEGLCASAASLIAMSGTKIIMKNGSVIMIHNPLTLAWGNSDELKQCAANLDLVRDSIVDIYAAKTGLARETLIDLMNRETYMNAQTAKELGFADEVEAVPEPENKPEEIPESESAASALNLFPVKNKIQDKQAAIIDMMAGYINGKRNH